MTASRNKAYIRIHVYIHRNWTKAGFCEQCQKVCKTQWANKDMLYLLNPDDWLELCPSCHFKYDRDFNGLHQNLGRPKGLKDKVKRKPGAGLHWAEKRKTKGLYILTQTI